MMSLEDLRIFLPKYLSADNYSQLISMLSDFPSNIDKRMYTSGLEPSIIYQGDGVRDMPVVNVENLNLGMKSHPCMILSNTCDMDEANRRLFPTTIMYAPIINLQKYESTLRNNGVSSEKIFNHLSDVRAQKVTSIFYLPSTGSMEESIVFLDRILNVGQRYIERDTYASRRIFSLSDYGFYLFVFKLSIHFSRIREGVNRGVIK